MEPLFSVKEYFSNNIVYGASIIAVAVLNAYMTFFFVRYVREYFKFKKGIKDISNDDLKKLSENII